jgi:hypothetical protein
MNILHIVPKITARCSWLWQFYFSHSERSMRSVLARAGWLSLSRVKSRLFCLCFNFKVGRSVGKSRLNFHTIATPPVRPTL